MQTQLIADIANNYYALLAYDKRLDVWNQTLQNRVKDVETMKALKEGDVVNGATCDTKPRLTATRLTLLCLTLKRNIRETESMIDILA